LIEVPEEAFSARKQGPKEFGRSMRLAAASHWYARGEISMEKAAMIAGMTRADFLDELASEKIEVFEVDLERLKREVEGG
jgi:predicted HTH domain antitoxin